VIDLCQTRERMLDAIAASADGAPVIGDPDDPRVASLAELRIALEGRTRSALFPALRAVLLRRFADVGPERLEGELFHPLKKGLGNAEKRGNRGDPDKRIRAELALTPRGAVVALTDEGPGFDVGDALQRLRRAEPYFTHGGSGLQTLEKSRSLVGYADGGRTLLLCFLRDPVSGRPPSELERADLGPAGDAERIGAALAAALAAERGTSLELRSCRIGISDEELPPREICYVLELRAGTPPADTRIAFVGRLLPESDARTELYVARHLSQRGFGAGTGIRVPRPRAMPGLPGLVLYEFEPSGDLRTHLSHDPPGSEVEAIVRDVGLGLRSLHESSLLPERERTPGDLLAGWCAAARRIARCVGEGSPESARLRRILGAIEERRPPARPLVPTHGAFGFDSIRRERDGFGLVGFGRASLSHPGVDLGGFLADLLRFHRLRRERDAGRYAPLRELFLAAYLGNASGPAREDLAVFVAGALLSRLERLLARPRAKWPRKVEGLLRECEDELSLGREAPRQR
jgi:hypothetical protein